MDQPSSQILKKQTEQTRKKAWYSIPINSTDKSENEKTSYKQILRPKLIVRLLLICLGGYLTAFLFFDSPYWLSGIWTALVTIGLFLRTVKLVDHSERKLVAFLRSLQQGDFSLTFQESKKSNEYDLHYAFNQLNGTFKNLRSDKESQHQLLQVVVEDAAVPLICFEEDNGDVYLTNAAAQGLLNVPFIQNINSLIKVDHSLVTCLKEIQDGEKASFKLFAGGKSIFLSITSRHIIFKDRSLKLIALHDVSSELAAKESETWQRMLKVLTHEISNSAIPLSTLSSYIYEMVRTAESQNRKPENEEWQDIIVALKTIDDRSRSLKSFVQNFKSVNQIPEPDLKRIKLSEIVNEVVVLFAQEIKDQDINLKVKDINESIFIHADKSLSMQVLINIMKNAIEAISNLKKNKSIELSVSREGKHFVQLNVRDSGWGISPENMEKIFIPFYSTKKGGSGIGLSISKQMMQKQKGDISVRSFPGEGSVFTLTFSSN